MRVGETRNDTQERDTEQNMRALESATELRIKRGMGKGWLTT